MRTVTKRDCVGCENDFYNGKNPLGVNECWSFKDATLVKRIRIGVWQPPPYKGKPISVPSCRHERGNCLIKPEALRADGFWKV